MSKTKEQAKKHILVALAGNPNSGKTTLFNRLTGSSHRVGNYPGVTVEKKEGDYYYQDTCFHIVDLPGIYSLTAYSMEEIIARRFLCEEKPDVVVNVVDASNLERNLYFTVQMLELGVNAVIALNMADELHQSGRCLNLKLFSERLRTPVVETVAHKGMGIEDLKREIAASAEKKANPIRIYYHPEIEEGVEKLEASMPELIQSLPYNRRFLALKLLEGDANILEILKKNQISPALFTLAETISHHLSQVCGDLPDIFISDGRYGFAAGLIRESTIHLSSIDRVNLSEKIDAFLTHRILALPIFLILMYFLFWMVFSLGEIPMLWIEYAFQWLSQQIQRIFPSDSFLSAFFVEAVIGGVGGVVVFLPNILLLFFGIAMLEDTGYMARAAFIMDRIMHKLGLHGKSFIPMLIGFGCTVPAIMATRTLENRRDRITTMLILPLMSCSARLPIYTLIIPAFFPTQFRALILWSIYLLGIILAGFLARIIRNTILKGDDTPFVMELPPYRLPTMKGLLHHMEERAWLYLKKAGSIILGISILLWLLSYYPRKTSFDVEARIAAGEQIPSQEIATLKTKEQLEYSILGRIGKTLEPVVQPMGFDWQLSTALLGAFAAKEVFVAQLGIIFCGQGTDSLREKLRRTYSPLIGICILIFCLIATPCISTLAVMAQESGSWYWSMLQFWGLTLIAYLLTTLVYQLGKLFL